MNLTSCARRRHFAKLATVDARMPDDRNEPAVITLDDAGSITGANETALALVGVSLGEFLAAPRGFLDATVPGRRTGGATGTGGVGRSTGTRRRQHAQSHRWNRSPDPVCRRPRDGGGFKVEIEPIQAPLDAPDILMTLGDVLSAWRRAEQRLAALDAETSEAMALREEAECLREMYQRGFAARRRTEPA